MRWPRVEASLDLGIGDEQRRQVSAAGDALQTFPPIVPTAWVCQPPTVAAASASAGNRLRDLRVTLQIRMRDEGADERAPSTTVTWRRAPTSADVQQHRGSHLAATVLQHQVRAAGQDLASPPEGRQLLERGVLRVDRAKLHHEVPWRLALGLGNPPKYYRIS